MLPILVFAIYPNVLPGRTTCFNGRWKSACNRPMNNSMTSSCFGKQSVNRCKSRRRLGAIVRGVGMASTMRFRLEMAFPRRTSRRRRRSCLHQAPPRRHQSPLRCSLNSFDHPVGIGKASQYHPLWYLQWSYCSHSTPNEYDAQSSKIRDATL